MLTTRVRGSNGFLEQNTQKNPLTIKKKKNDETDDINTENFYLSKETIKKMKT